MYRYLEISNDGSSGLFFRHKDSFKDNNNHHSLKKNIKISLNLSCFFLRRSYDIYVGSRNFRYALKLVLA